MYLTRMCLDESNPNTAKALASPHIFHGTVERCFGGERKRNLWRIDHLNHQLYLMLLSPDKPDLSAAAEQFGVLCADCPWETKSYTPFLERISRGSVWHFRLVANPTKSCVSEPGKRGKVHAHVSVPHQKEWLQTRAAHNGFSLNEEDFTVVHSQWHIFRKNPSQEAKVRLLAVTYEGVLTVTNTELFCKALTEGIGRGKAYGMGLLTVARIASNEK